MPVKPSFAPAYSRIYQEIVSRINAGQWKPGDQLPTESALAQKHGVSIGTVRKAMDMLAQAGFCIKEQGKGTFVTEHTEDRPLFYRMRPSLGGQDVPIQTGTVQVEEISLSGEPALLLEQPEGSRGVRVSRTLYRRGEDGLLPVGLSESLFPSPRCDGLLRTPLNDFQKHSLYYLIDRDCRSPMLHSEEMILICPDPPHAFGKLFSARPSCCFDLRMLTRTYEDAPLEYRRSFIDGMSLGLMRDHDLRP